MKFRDGKSGRFPLVPVLVAAPLLLGLLWCVYDGYWPRPLTLEAIYQVGGQAEVLDRSDNRVALHLPHPVPERALFIVISNRSQFFLNGARVVFVTKDAEGGVLSIQEAPCLHLGAEDLDVPPQRAEASRSHHCVAALSEKTLRSLASVDFDRHDWYFSELRGHRAPVRLIRRPLEIFSLMFERIYD